MRIFTYIGLLFILTVSSVLARGGLTENQRSLAIAAGIAAPSFNVTGDTENPVGYSFNATGKLHGYVSVPQNSNNLSLYDAGGKLNYGRGYYGVSIGYRYSKRASTQADGIVDGGVSGIIKGLNLGFGINGYWRASSQSNGKPSADASAAVLFNPYGRLKVGFGVFGINGGANTIGGGVAFGLAKQLTFALDGGVNGEFKGWTIKPGLGIHLMNLQLSIAYGIKLDNSASTGISKELMAGVAIWPSRFFMIQAYFQHDQKVFIGTSLRI